MAFAIFKLKGTDGHTGLALEAVIPAFGAPVQAVPEMKETEPRNPRLLIPLVSVPPNPISVPVMRLQPPPEKV